MNERLRESLSALMDDEADELELERLLSRIGDDGELRQVWTRYHAVRGALSGQFGAGLPAPDISGRVREALAQERVPAAAGPERWWRPLASFAVAASVAAVVVVGGQQLSQMSAPGAPVTASAAPVGIGSIAGATPVQASYGTQALPELQPASHTAYRELARQRMQRFLQEHAEHAALNSPQGMIPFARVERISE
jgi:sigma-E factor negative regulatory protein RseA